MRWWEIIEGLAFTVKPRNRKDSKFSAILRHANDPDQMAFVHLIPEETGLTRTVWVSEDNEYCYVIVSDIEGRFVHPSSKSYVLTFDGTSPFQDVNIWLNNNRHLLKPLADQDIDISYFFDNMKKYSAKKIDEMVNITPKLSNLPMVVYCSPRNSSHDVRVKVCIQNGDKMYKDLVVIVALRPFVHYPDSELRKLPSQDFDRLKAWLDLNRQLIIDYWDMKIATDAFRSNIQPI